ncbi:MAG: tetratricopeptide repeat protein [Actinobacteria bacterium]|nr:tetratricopeptide repeat protein [Actinomycetota bacterium]
MSASRHARWEEAGQILEGAGNAEGLALYWQSVAFEAWIRCRAAECAAASERSIAHAKLAESGRRVRDNLVWICACYALGPMAVHEAIERVEEIRLGAYGTLVEALASIMIGQLTAMQGEFDSARILVRGGRQTWRDAGLPVFAAAMAMFESLDAWRAGDDDARERVLREGLEELERLGDHGYASTTALYLADCLYSRGRLSEAQEFCTRGRELTSTEDVVNFILLEGLQATLSAGEGRHDEAEAGARRAIELAEATDFFETHAWTRRMLAETLALLGRSVEAAEPAEEALAIRRAKGDMTGAERDRERFAELGIEVG